MAIEYEKIGWDTSKYINPTDMNHMDDGIKAACDGVDKNTQAIEAVNSNLTGLQFKVLTARLPSSRTAFYLGAFADSPEKGFIVSAMCSTDKITWISSDKISDIAFAVNAANNGQGQVRGDIGNEAYYGKWCKVIVASID
nr:MAG TPA: hypothetical protein [Caudoviricetes sp.]